MNGFEIELLRMARRYPLIFQIIITFSQKGKLNMYIYNENIIITLIKLATKLN